MLSAQKRWQRVKGKFISSGRGVLRRIQRFDSNMETSASFQVDATPLGLEEPAFSGPVRHHSGHSTVSIDLSPYLRGPLRVMNPDPPSPEEEKIMPEGWSGRAASPGLQPSPQPGYQAYEAEAINPPTVSTVEGSSSQTNIGSLTPLGRFHSLGRESLESRIRSARALEQWPNVLQDSTMAADSEGEQGEAQAPWKRLTVGSDKWQSLIDEISKGLQLLDGETGGYGLQHSRLVVSRRNGMT
ncbi:MAG: hypothetical protein Q9181_007033 [Wetmoreana brouardii]